MTPEDLVGAWELADFRVELGDGRPPVFPFGEDGQGRLMYSASGKMSAILCRADRPPLSVDQLEQSGRAPTEEKAAAFDSYMSYAGRYRLEGDKVVHEVEFGLMPNIVGREQWRDAAFDGDELVLGYDVETPKGTRRFTLRWRRV